MLSKAYGKGNIRIGNVNVIIYALKISFIVIHPEFLYLFFCVRKYGQDKIYYISDNSKTVCAMLNVTKYQKLRLSNFNIYKLLKGHFESSRKWYESNNNSLLVYQCFSK